MKRFLLLLVFCFARVAHAAYLDNTVAQGASSSGITGPMEQALAASSAPAWVNGTINPLSLTLAGALRVDGSATVQPVSGTFWQATQPVSISGNQAVNNTQWNGNTVDSNSGVKSAGTLRVVLATDQPQLTNKLLVTPDSVALPANQSVNVSQMNGVTTSMGAGASDTGTQRVMIANDVWQDLFLTGQSAQTATVNNILPATAGANATNLTGYRSGLVQVVSTGTGGTFIFEGSNDNTNFQTIPVWNQNILTGTPITAAITATSSQLGYTFPVQFRYIRLRIATTITGGSIQAFSDFQQAAWTPAVFQIAQATAGNLNVTLGSGTVTTVTTLANGQTAHSSASTGSPLRVGGRVITTPDLTLAQGDASDLAVTTGQQLVTKPYGSAENDWTYVSPASGTITNTTTPVSIAPARSASVRNYITQITLSADALGTATELAVRDVALTASSQTIASNILVTSTSHGLAVGDSVVASASTVTGFTAGTAYHVLTVPSGTSLTFSATPGGSTLAISGTGVTATFNHYLWRQKLQTAGVPQPLQFFFPTPLRGGSAVADEVVTLTASTGGVFFNCTGYQGF